MEGIKSITEFINSDYTVDTIYCADDLLPKLPKLYQNLKVFKVTAADLHKISALQTPQGVIAIVKIPLQQPSQIFLSLNEMHLVLDGVQDPGNLGTIIRTAEWFGFKHIICSEDTVEMYNPKVVQATMGSLARMKIIYTALKPLLESSDLPVFGAVLNGENIYNTNWPKSGFMIFGSEGNGISQEVKLLITKPLTIPGAGLAESLNVAISVAVCCSEIKRNSFK